MVHRQAEFRLRAGLPGMCRFMRLHKSRIGKFFLLPAGRTLYLVFDVTQNAMKGHVSDDRAMLFSISNEETGCRQEFAIASHVYKCIMHLAEADPSRHGSSIIFRNQIILITPS